MAPTHVMMKLPPNNKTVNSFVGSSCFPSFDLFYFFYVFTQRESWGSVHKLREDFGPGALHRVRQPHWGRLCFDAIFYLFISIHHRFSPGFRESWYTRPWTGSEWHLKLKYYGFAITIKAALYFAMLFNDCNGVLVCGRFLSLMFSCSLRFPKGLHVETLETEKVGICSI